jgi:hypothetical protein
MLGVPCNISFLHFIPDPSDEDQTEEESVFLETTQSAEIDGPSSEPCTSQPELDEVKGTDVTGYLRLVA